MKKAKPQTIITVPVSKGFLRGIAVGIALLVIATWTIATPDDFNEIVIGSLGCIVGLFFAFLLLTSENIETIRPLREGLQKVAPGLWRGALGEEVFSFEKYDLDVVVDLRDDREISDKKVDVPVGKRYMKWPMLEKELPDPEEIDALASFLAIKASANKVGVFCTMGLNRSGFLCAMVALKIKENAEAGVEEVKKYIWTESYLDAIDGEHERMDNAKKFKVSKTKESKDTEEIY